VKVPRTAFIAPEIPARIVSTRKWKFDGLWIVNQYLLNFSLLWNSRNTWRCL
jgi:hypothetical protein